MRQTIRLHTGAVDQAQASTSGILELLRERSGSSGSAPRSMATLLDGAWDELAAALGAQVSEPSEELSRALMRLRVLDQQLLRRIDTTGARLAPVVAQLEALPCDVDTLITMAPRLVCELGFDRAVISRVDDGVWTSECAYIPDEPEWSRTIEGVGRSHPQHLDSGLHETEIVRRRVGLLVTEAQEDPRVNRPIIEAAECHSYVATPIAAGGRVRGFVHADRFRTGIDLDGEDCHLLGAFTQILQIALSRARMSEQLSSARQGLLGLIDGLDDAGPSSPMGCSGAVGSTRRSTGLAGASGHRRRADPLAATRLTAREQEVLALLAAGMTNDDIAAELVISVSTVKDHVKNVLRKTQSRNRSEATALWHQSNRR
ncbi:LuxR C-terminal-related transcriptional regulator [Gordonia sp. i37]|uniref:LuxR C-terminal-related transcriptional regulator n=1 Tax=Gordonia sp. i37 TaxID=1961707 RepID=UPI0009ADC8DB|nr:LuxR C-terminal-related transcriptional regulator [Gordonia sp. i37]